MYVTRNTMLNWVNKSGLNMSIEQGVEQGRWWVVQQKGEALITTAKTMMVVQLLTALGLHIERRDVDQCDECYGFSFKSCGMETGPTQDGVMIPVLWFCHDCTKGMYSE